MKKAATSLLIVFSTALAVVVSPLSAQVATGPPRDRAATQNVIGTARIRGRVVAADTGSPLRRAHVRINTVEGRVTRAATTDDDGRFDFGSLPAGRYFINVSRPGYVPLQFGQQRPFQSGKAFALSEGQLADRVDFALPRGSVIAGRITDEYGEPAPGIRVQAMRYQYGSTGQRRLISGSTGMYISEVTDDRGEFRIFGLSPGTYVLAANPGHNDSMWMYSTETSPAALRAGATDPNEGYATTYYPGVPSPSEAQTITLGLSQEIAVSFPLVAARLSRLSGTILNSRGQPVTEAQLSLRPVQPGVFSASGIRLLTGGTFIATSVAPGDYFIDVRPHVTYTPGKPAPAPPADAEFASVPIAVSGADISGIVITTGQGATLAGRMIFDGNSPRPTGQVRVFAAPADDYGSRFGNIDSPDNGRVGENDRFHIRVVSGKVLFRAVAARWNLKSVSIGGIDITDVPLDVSTVSRTNEIEIILTDRQPELAGTVTNASGEPVKDYFAVIVPNTLPQGILPNRFTASLRSDENGRYEIRFLPPGSYFAMAVESHDPGAQWDPAFQEIVRARGKPFTLSEGDKLTLDLHLLQ